MRTADLLIHAHRALPIRPANTVLNAHSVAVRDGRIAAVMPSADARRNWLAALRKLKRTALCEPPTC